MEEVKQTVLEKLEIEYGEKSKPLSYFGVFGLTGIEHKDQCSKVFN